MADENNRVLTEVDREMIAAIVDHSLRERVDYRLNAIESRLAAMESRITRVEAKLDQLLELVAHPSDHK